MENRSNTVIPLCRSMTIAQAIETVLRDRPATTATAYRKALLCFSRFLGSSTIDEGANRFFNYQLPEAEKALENYVTDMQQAGYAPATIRHRVHCVTAIALALHEMGVVDWRPPRVPLPPAPPASTEMPTDRQLRKILSLLDTKLANRGNVAPILRDRVIVHLAIHHHLQRAEVASLLVSDVALDPPRLKIGQRLIELAPATAEVMRAWIAARGNAPGGLLVRLDSAGKGAMAPMSGEGIRCSIGPPRSGLQPTSEN